MTPARRKRAKRSNSDEPEYFVLSVLKCSSYYSFSINDYKMKELDHAAVFEHCGIQIETVVEEPDRFKERPLLVRIHGDRDMVRDLMATPFATWHRTRIGMLNIRGKEPAEAWCFVPSDAMAYILGVLGARHVDEISLKVVSLRYGSGEIRSVDLGKSEQNSDRTTEE